MARLVALWYSALFEVRLGNAERVAALADEMHVLVEEFALAHGRAAWRWFRGWADARMGHPREGYRAIREAYEDNMRLGMVVGATEILGYATEALLLAGDLVAAEAQLKEALAIAGERQRARVSAAALPHAGCDSARARRSQRRRRLAAARARRGEIATSAVARVDGAECAVRQRGRNAEDRKALTTLVDRMPEASDTDAIAKARTLLAKQARFKR